MGASFKKDGVTFGAERFYQIKQTLDPSRLMIDQDGACSPQTVGESDTTPVTHCAHHTHYSLTHYTPYTLFTNTLHTIGPRHALLLLPPVRRLQHGVHWNRQGGEMRRRGRAEQVSRCVRPQDACMHVCPRVQSE
jgi:hypothetical protein